MALIAFMLLFHHPVDHKPAVFEDFIQWQVALVNALRGDLQVLTHFFAQGQVIAFCHAVAFSQRQRGAVGHQTHGAWLEKYDDAVRWGVIFDEIVSFNAVGIERPVDLPAST